jgi:hypothetical protein
MRPARGSTELKNAPGKEERRTAVVSPETGCDAEIRVDAGSHIARRGLRVQVFLKISDGLGTSLCSRTEAVVEHERRHRNICETLQTTDRHRQYRKG